MKRAYLRLVGLLLVIAGMLLLSAGCQSNSAIGDRNQQTTLALLRFEKIDQDFSGVVYREINDFAALIHDVKTPVLVAFYHPMNPANARIIPQLEQMADDYQNQLAIVWIDATAQTYLAESLGAEVLPQFILLDKTEVQATMTGYGSAGASDLALFVEPYLS